MLGVDFIISEMEKKHTIFSVSNLLVGCTTQKPLSLSSEILFSKYNVAHTLFHLSIRKPVKPPIPECFICVARFSSQLACLTNRALDIQKYDYNQMLLTTVSDINFSEIRRCFSKNVYSFFTGALG